ncbi:MAG TPA: molybdopterin-dependent oxidoreductase, partial [Firmicutes bacterium]|nr:molybdopterin-dependent oxidoreductase [Bacillota bacterium]
MATEIKKAGCFFCHHNCGVLVHVEDGRVVKVTGNSEHPGSRGHICERAARAPQWLYHPDQLRHALKRVGGRGEGKWRQIPWEEALDEIAAKLSELKAAYGPETLLAAEGTYRTDLIWARARFFNLFGNPQNMMAPGTVCMCNLYSIDLALAGAMIMPDIARSRCVVLWGANPKEARLVQWRVLKKKKEEGALKIISIDPWITASGEIADIRLQLRPGTDGALALGWLHVIIEESLYDSDFVANWTHGFSQLAARVKEYTPRKVAEITGLSPEAIVASARLYATSGASCINRGVATDQLGLNSGRVEQMRVALAAITGNLDVPGGDLLSQPSTHFGGKKFVCESELELADKCPPEQKEKMIGSDNFRLMTWSAWETVNRHYQKQLGIPCPQLHYLAVPAPVALRQIISAR